MCSRFRARTRDQDNLLRPFPATTHHLIYPTSVIASRPGHGLAQRNFLLLIVQAVTRARGMGWRVATDDTLIDIERRLIQPPSLIWPVVA